MALRDGILNLVTDSTFTEELKRNWQAGKKSAPNNPQISDRVKNLVALELDAFPRAVEVASVQDPKGEKSWLPRWLGRASTITGSIKELCETHPHLKAGLMLLKELLDIFKG